MTSHPVVLITPDDAVLGVIDKETAHHYAMLHRAFSVFIYRMHEGELELLIQQRNLNKYHCGGLWTNTCCSHPMLSESIKEAGERRLYEELGFQVPLEVVGRFHYVAALDNDFFENELDYVVQGELKADIPIPFNTEEIAAIQWISLSKLRQWLINSPEEWTPWFEKALAVFLNA